VEVHACISRLSVESGLRQGGNCTNHLLLLLMLHKVLTIDVCCKEHQFYMYFVAEKSKLGISLVNNLTT
jgi:hypothetical protein